MILDPNKATMLATVMASNKTPTINPDDHLVVGDRVKVPSRQWCGVLGVLGFREQATVNGFFNKTHRVAVKYDDDNSIGFVPRGKVRKISSI